MITNFPNGVSSFGIPLVGSGPIFTTGSVFFVDSGAGSNGNDGTRDRPFATIDYTVGRCAADNGDYIIVMPGHTETVTAAGGLDLDVAGITVMGVPVGGSGRATVNFTTATTADADVDAANIRVFNFLWTGGFDALEAPIDVNSADFEMGYFEWRDVTGQAVDPILTAAVARTHLHHFRFDSATAAGPASMIALVGGDNVYIHDFMGDGDFSVGGIDVRTTATTDLVVRDCQYFRNRNAADIFIIDTITGSTGQIGPNIYIRLADNAANITEAVTGATFTVMDDVYVVNAANEKGLLINWTASADTA